MMDLKGRVAVITGAGSGIGRGLASVLVEEGMRLLLLDIEADALVETEAMVQSAGADAASQVADVARPEEMERAADFAYRRFGATHLLCLNAGVVARFAPLWEQTDEEWRWVFGVNVGGVLAGIRAFVPRLMEQDDDSHVLITASEAAFSSRPYVGIYHASKHAVLAIAETLALELQLAGGRTRVSALFPGAVSTRVMDPRNRPESIGAGEPSSLSPGAAALEARYRRNLASLGAPPDAVARTAIEGLKRGDFYVFPHAAVRDRLVPEAERIRQGSYPALDRSLRAEVEGAAR
jgi:NAD(P)-dependent dehydrogenase (short-subunit alcohol dehydrogenase family)